VDRSATRFRSTGDRGGPGDDVVVVANFRTEPRDRHVIGFPAAGVWTLRLNSDWRGYSDDFGDHPGADVVAEPGERDGFPFHGAVSIGPYSVLVYSR
jgi:1,4-alpha-glucan branching enzyme